MVLSFLRILWDRLALKSLSNQNQEENICHWGIVQIQIISATTVSADTLVCRAVDVAYASTQRISIVVRNAKIER